MESKKKKKKLLDNTPNQPSKFKAKSWAEINDGGRATQTAVVKVNLRLQC